jgi:O-antigen/teichoic acid export membrane protein
MALAVAALLRALGASDPLLYTAALAVSYAPTTGLAYHFLARVQPSAPGDAHLTREALAFGGWVTVGSLAFVVFQRVDMFLLASAAPSGEVGIYGAASRLSMVGGLFGSTLTAVMMPKGSRQVTWTKQATRRAYIRESVVTVLLMTSALVVMIATAGPLTLLVFGKAYASAVPYSRILLLAQILLIAQMPFYFAMYALGGGRWIAGLGVLQAVIAIGAGYSLIERYGASGAAWSNVVTYAVGAIGVVAFHLTAARWRPA